MRLPDPEDYRTMVRNLLCTMTAFALLVAACGDDKGTTDSTTSPLTTGNTSTDAGTTTPDTPTTTTPDLTTTGVDPSTTTTAGPTTDPSTTTTGDDTTTNVTSLSSSTDPDTTDPSTTTGDPAAECKMMVDPPNDPCGNCACDNCLAELDACNQDEGCKAIRECAQETGCTDAPSCFMLCGNVIGMYPGSIGTAQNIADCINNNCQAECAG